MTKISGFQVVRKPQYSKSTFHNVPIQVCGKIYRGLDRLPWEDLDTGFYSKTLPTELLLAKKTLQDDNRDLSGIVLSRDFELTSMVHNCYSESSEIIAMWSEELKHIKGEFDWLGALKFYGYDCISLGEWSLILAGLFLRPQHFCEFIDRINENGLFVKNEDCKLLFSRYLELSKSGLVEPLRDEPLQSSVKVYGMASSQFIAEIASSTWPHAAI